MICERNGYGNGLLIVTTQVRIPFEITELRWCSGQTTRLSPLRFRVRSPVRWTRTQSSCEESKVNALPKVVGFLRVLRFPPTGKVDRVG